MKHICLILFVLLANLANAQTPSASYFNPVFSPDGKRIAFEADKSGKFGIYIINTDGTGLQKLTADDHVSQNARWSPDGTKIVFQSRRDGHLQLYIMNADGSAQRRLTNGPDLDAHPYFSPKGDLIVFQSRPPGQEASSDIYVIGPDGSGRQKLTDGKSNYGSPRWSPDGKKIVFSTSAMISKLIPNFSPESMAKMTNDERYQLGVKLSNSSELYLMNADGSNIQRLTNNEVRDNQPEWSKDSRTIYFMTEIDGVESLCAMDVESKNVRKIADGKVIRGSNISKDGKRFVYERYVNEKSGIYIYNLKTKKEKLLIEG